MTQEHIDLIGFALLFLLVYFIPSFIAFNREHNNRAAICAFNVLLGWVPILWIVAIIWSFTGNTHKNTASVDTRGSK